MTSDAVEEIVILYFLIVVQKFVVFRFLVVSVVLAVRRDVAGGVDDRQITVERRRCV